MSAYPIHTLATAPAESQEQLQMVQATIGRIPNLAAGMAESPSFLKGFFTLRGIYIGGTLSSVDIEVVSLTNAVENRCAWCVAFHSAMALKSGLSEPALTALRAGRRTGVTRVDALAGLARVLIRKRGLVTDQDLDPFYAAGFSQGQALEVVLGVGFSVLANYAAHLIHPPLEAGLEGQRWSPG
jgi:AhpD family alkylhydroperoxidase